MIQKQRTILLVDDCPEDRELYRYYLLEDSEYTYTFLEEEYGENGLALCSQILPDVILLDFLLPDMDGLEFLSRLQTQLGCTKLPVVMLTAQGNEAIAVQAMKNGAQDYLVKGNTTPESLQTAVHNVVERVHLQQPLLKSERRFRTSIENMLDCFGIYTSIRDKSGRIVDFEVEYVNAAACTDYCMIQEYQIGKRLLQLQPSYQQTGLFADYCSVVETGEPLLKEALIYADLENQQHLSRAFDIRAAKLGDGLVAAWRDVTESKQAQERLRLLESVVVNANDGVFITATEVINQSSSRIVYVNEAFTRMTGYSPQEVLGKSPRLLLQGPKSNRAALQSLRTALQTKQPVEVEMINYRKDGSQFWVELSVTPVADENRNYTHFVAMQRDITERKQAEEAMQQLNANLERQVQERTLQLQQALEFEAMLKRITDKVRDSLDESQIMQTAVQELALVLGISGCNAAWYNLDQGTSTICYEYVTKIPAYRRRAMQMADFPEIYRQILQGQYFQFCSILPNPVRGHVAMLACPIINDEGVQGDLWLINHKDYIFNDLEIRLVQQVANQCAIAIRQARLYQAATAQVKELEKLNRLKDDFLSTVSHELRTPVTNMKMAIHMLQLAPGLQQRERYLKILQVECDRELELINNLLDLQIPLEAVSHSNELTAVDIHNWLPKIIEPFQMRVSERQQSLRLALPSSLLPLFCDRASLERVLAELLNNAYKYTATGGEIILRVCHQRHQEKSSTIFTISNSAEIPVAELPHIFDKFYRVPNGNPWQQSGTGLGLALVQKLVKRLQGTIQVESSRGWTTFTVQLPSQLMFEDEVAEEGRFKSHSATGV